MSETWQFAVALVGAFISGIALGVAGLAWLMVAHFAATINKATGK